jgi:hypothetical protein
MTPSGGGPAFEVASDDWRTFWYVLAAAIAAAKDARRSSEAEDEQDRA